MTVHRLQKAYSLDKVHHSRMLKASSQQVLPDPPSFLRLQRETVQHPHSSVVTPT